ncbi:MAG: hypothetical protein ABIV43_00435 [Candidatus Saccharimonadales bacterium]
MRVLLAMMVLVGAYMYLLLHTTTIVLGQTEQLSRVYQTAAAQ